jgi:hypothetical protein
MGKKINIYLICEGTSCEFVEKCAGIRTTTSKKSSISDYGLIESYYFNRNSDNTEYFNDNNSIYLTSTKRSCIDSSLIIYGNGGEGRRVFPIPYTTNGKYIQSMSDLRSLMDEIALNKSVNKYMKQNKFEPLSSYLPSYHVELNWTFQSKNISDYTRMNISKFITFVHKLIEKNEDIENIFLVCDAPFIISMMNITNQNKYSTINDMIEHTSFWKFEFEIKKEGLWGSYVPKITSRHKLYPLGRNHGLLQQYDDLFFYIYKDLRIPLFHHNKPIPKNYLESKYITLCKSIRGKEKVGQKNESKSNKQKIVRTSNNTFKKTLQKIRLNQFMK